MILVLVVVVRSIKNVVLINNRTLNDYSNELLFIKCSIDQVLKITDILQVNEDTREKITREVLQYFQGMDYNQSNPEVMKGTWDIISKKYPIKIHMIQLRSFIILK